MSQAKTMILNTTVGNRKNHMHRPRGRLGVIRIIRAGRVGKFGVVTLVCKLQGCFALEITKTLILQYENGFFQFFAFEARIAWSVCKD